jgi:putative ABC transport system permease protein
VARSRIDPAALAPALRHAVQLADPAGKIPSVKRMDEMLSDSVTQRRQRTYLLGAFAALSLLVAMVGVYGVVAYSVARRTHEIGVRMALGAQPGDVLRMVLGEGLKLALAGAALGLALTLWLSRALASFLFGVGPRDALTFAAASAILTVAVCVASYLPSRQATRVDPATALRRE